MTSEPFEQLDRQWRSANARPAPVRFFPLAAFYGISFGITVGWMDPFIWFGKCGVPWSSQSLLCLLFGFVAGSAALWAGFLRRDWSAATRFFVSGAAPLLFPTAVNVLGRLTQLL